MMRARNRHNASNYLFAAFLELVIMVIFVIIAQPQLRESLFEMLEPPARATAAPASAETDSPVVANQQPYSAGSPAGSYASDRAAPSNTGWSMSQASYAPLEHFEAFTVSTAGAPVPTTPASVTTEKRVAGYAPSVGATQLSAIDWNIASASESPRPLSGWTAPRPVETDFRDTYPPPYGTQSQWK